MIQVLNIIIILEIWLIWMVIFDTELANDIFNFFGFYFHVLCACVSFICFFQSSTVTQEKNQEIIRQITIG